MIAEIAFPYNVLQEIFVNLNFAVFAILATIISSIACIEFMKKIVEGSKAKESAVHQYVTVSKYCISALVAIFLILTFGVVIDLKDIVEDVLYMFIFL
ncbi:Uncharacterised protein [Anaerostipes hadrus]|uniref:Uncharacterized protein n=1 Tax=Anaerostipes hadrus TaxID=649756 RepID=A0A174NTY2_ANAHA|nr:hypothetical protein [Anaerostipes hadrus]CUP50000.1 Uncharacterised protein [Anaerostipes hadrus]